MTEEKRGIVCIEDESEIADIVRLILERKEFTVIATGEHKGLETVRRIKPDLVVLINKKGDKNFLDFFREMRADEELQSISIISVSTHQPRIPDPPPPPWKIEWIRPPFGPQELLNSVYKALG